MEEGLMSHSESEPREVNKAMLLRTTQLITDGNEGTSSMNSIDNAGQFDEGKKLQHIFIPLCILQT